MKRRDFLTAAGAGTLAGLAAPSQAAPARIRWKMVTTWPKNFPGLGTGAERLAKLINRLSGGRMEVRVYGAGELVPAFETFDAVSRGTAQMGHGAAYYWKGKNPAFQFFSTVPFGLTAEEMNGWLFYGGGLKLWRQAYADFGLVPFPAGNTGVQMAGWFNKKIRSLDDLKGLKMRIPGLGGEVLKRAGGTPVNLPGGELFTALKSGAIDATEWVGPYNDLAFGLYKAAKYYYYPGWHEPGTTLECIVNAKAFAALPADLKAVVAVACQAVNADMPAEYAARNGEALKTLVEEHHVTIERLPDDVLARLKALSDEVVAELAGHDAFARRVFESYQAYRKRVSAWTDLSTRPYLNARG